MVVKPVKLKAGLLGWIRRRLVSGALLNHNGDTVTAYNANTWFLAPFPAAKGAPYVADNLATVNTSSFRLEQGFRRAGSEAVGRWSDKENPRDISWRLHVAIFAARLGIAGATPGDCAIEFGTGRGFMVAGILEALGATSLEDAGVSFFLMDTFRPEWQGENAIAFTGGKEPGAEGSKPWYYADGSAEVKAYFSKFQNVHVVEGMLPDTLALTGNAPIAFAHVDLNSAASESECLDAIRPRLRKGSVVLFDDSTNPGCKDQLDVHRSFAHSVGGHLLELPTGQSLLVLP